jgi:uncharacterized membrane protein (UPF0127 family)
MTNGFTNTLLAVVALAALILAVSVFTSTGAVQCPDGILTSIVEVGGQQVQVEIANTNASRYQGMSGREGFRDGWGMLFVYPTEQPRTFCMRNCLVDIDILFLDQHGVIVALHEMKREIIDDPRRLYPSDKPAMYALELRAGTISQLNLQPGMSVVLHNVPPPHTAEYE